MRINVTQEHIDKGQQYDSTLCPVALAIKAATRRRRVTVGWHLIKLAGIQIPTPRSAARAVRRVDSGLSIRPFTFELEGI